MWFRDSKARAEFIQRYDNGSQCEWHLVPLRRESHGFYDRRERRWYWGKLSSGYHQSLHDEVKTLLKNNRTFRYCRFVRCDAAGTPINVRAGIHVWSHEDNTLSLGFLTKGEAALFKLIYKE